MLPSQTYPIPHQFNQAPSAPPMEMIIEAELRRQQHQAGEPVPGAIPSRVSPDYFQTYETDSFSNGGNRGNGGTGQPPRGSGNENGDQAAGHTSAQPAATATACNTQKKVDPFHSIRRKHEEEHMRRVALQKQIVELSGIQYTTGQFQQQQQPDSPSLYPSLPQQTLPPVQQSVYVHTAAAQMRREPPKMTFGTQYAASASAQNAYIPKKK